MREYDHSGACR